MSRKIEKEIYVSLDIGTSEIAVIVAEGLAGGADDLEIVGVGISESKGMKKGLVSNVQELSASIDKAIIEAENMADCQISNVFAGISGTHVTSIASHGLAAGPRRQISEYDVARAIATAQQYSFMGDYELLHSIPRSFKLDGMGGIKEPVGMSGVRLETDVHLISCSVTALENIRNCLKRSNIHAEKIILEQIAASYAVLNEDEKELGVCLVDIGAGTTDIAVYHDGSIQHTAVIPIAGDHVTNDIAVQLRTPTRSAEKLKCESGNSWSAPDDDRNEEIEVPIVGDQAGKKITQQNLQAVIQSRFEELFDLIVNELARENFERRKLVSGIVLTGGSALIPGITTLAEEIFHLPVRCGKPQGTRGFEDILGNPRYATAIGLLRAGLIDIERDPAAVHRGFFRSLWGRLKRNL